MKRTLLKSKIHRATVTEADVDYEGSVTLDSALMEQANIVPWEKIHVWDVTNGARIETYAIPGKPASGVVCINGGAAHLIKKGHLVIIATFTEYDEAEVKNHHPIKIFVDSKNRIIAE